MPVQQAILAKKAALAQAIRAPLSAIARRCAEAWPDPDRLDAILLEAIHTVPACHLLYCWDLHGIELSSMVGPDGTDTAWRGRDLSQRPYLKHSLPFEGTMLSSVYQSVYTNKPCVTALQAVRRGDQLLGFVAADFAVTDLLRNAELARPAQGWRQFRGDPAVRGTVFTQTRAHSLLDERMDEVLAAIGTLMRDHGVFHSKIHFSSGRFSLWLMDDPYNYRLHGVEEIVDPELCLAYPLRGYPENAKVAAGQIDQVLTAFKALRFADETIYLRSGSLNVMNALVGLTFSCDGSHYMPVEEFLAKDLTFWFGQNEECEIPAA
ncbi:hypothetical protein SVA_1073 [Sulfurifustis variabilis]|uniref:Uncharacterized protein n=1 Tax=Sulfurifustis variabilis TaxID=1675686 RepID=A0A1B4V534_9GAMM|nr:PDC sensor domain-containing protein [Sulfurifustis variabilis]BAU47652.1 hypothetical protein SVA_1073 [Sulfurifustis variabilis]